LQCLIYKGSSLIHTEIYKPIYDLAKSIHRRAHNRKIQLK
jgi:hypothetical protein